MDSPSSPPLLQKRQHLAALRHLGGDPAFDVQPARVLADRRPCADGLAGSCWNSMRMPVVPRVSSDLAKAPRSTASLPRSTAPKTEA
jgi:hypothetical protein